MIKKVLLLPFLSMASGHHRVAETIQDRIAKHFPHILYKKIDVLHYGYGSFERFITNFYLQWIRRSPDSYHLVYSALAGSKTKKERKHHRMYEVMFLNVVRRMLRIEKPDLIFCTHSLPSYILSLLKQRNEIDVPVVNVYTDFFINNLWGTSGIDMHWVADGSMKRYLIEKGVPESSIFTTGIPVNKYDSCSDTQIPTKPPFTILVSGGNLGVGGLDKFIQKLGSSPQFKYIVLCGKNERLYRKLSAEAARSAIQPLPFIDSPEIMNRIYAEVDAVFCKPGGVTISECLLRQKPVFVFGALPGQETYNLNRLKRNQLVWDLSQMEQSGRSIEHTVAQILMSRSEMNRWKQQVERFNEPLCNWDELLRQMVTAKRSSRLNPAGFLH